jgi:hypothetical protein
MPPNRDRFGGILSVSDEASAGRLPAQLLTRGYFRIASLLAFGKRSVRLDVN